MMIINKCGGRQRLSCRRRCFVSLRLVRSLSCSVLSIYSKGGVGRRWSIVHRSSLRSPQLVRNWRRPSKNFLSSPSFCLLSCVETVVTGVYS